MKKTSYLLLAMTVFVVLSASACGGSPAPATQAALPPVEAAPVDAVAPTQQSVPAQTFAPACQAAASCAAPAMKDSEPTDSYCVQKIPYQNFLIEDGVTFESLNSDTLICSDNGTIVDGKHVVACHGKQLWTSQLKFTNTACGGASLTTGTGQCQEGLGYDAAQNCCAPITATGTGSVTIKVNMGACP